MNARSTLPARADGHGATNGQSRREWYRNEYLQSDHWQQQRTAALERAGHRCQVCNGNQRLDVHHRTYERLGDELAADLTVLCRKCHELFHGSRKPKRAADRKRRPQDLSGEAVHDLKQAFKHVGEVRRCWREVHRILLATPWLTTSEIVDLSATFRPGSGDLVGRLLNHAEREGLAERRAVTRSPSRCKWEWRVFEKPANAQARREAVKRQKLAPMPPVIVSDSERDRAAKEREARIKAEKARRAALKAEFTPSRPPVRSIPHKDRRQG